MNAQPMPIRSLERPAVSPALPPFPMENLHLHPSKDSFADAESWSNGFQAVFAEAAGRVGTVLPLRSFPSITLVAHEHAERFRQDNGIPRWADAFSSGKEIFICSPLPPEILAPVLAHEIFHFEVTARSGSRPCLLDWFNESLAYLVQGETATDHKLVQTYLKYDSTLVLRLMLEDKFLAGNRIEIPLIKAFGRFLGNRFPYAVISDFLARTFLSGDFHSSIVATLGINLGDLLEEWLGHLTRTDNRQYYEDPVRYVG